MESTYSNLSVQYPISIMAADRYPDPEKKRNRGYLGHDSSGLPPRERQAGHSLFHPRRSHDVLTLIANDM